MEGKSLLFKRFADVDVFDIEIDARTPTMWCGIVKPLEPTFGGINLEDIKAPECFEIERGWPPRWTFRCSTTISMERRSSAGRRSSTRWRWLGKAIDEVRMAVRAQGRPPSPAAEFFVQLGMPANT